MSRGAYVFMRRYIHFADNHRQAEKGQPGYDALYKVWYPLDIMMAGIRAALTAGKHITVNESMIRYMGRAVTYVQYVPAKAIKHGVKVFCLCCAISAVLLSFKVYVGNQGGGRASRGCWAAKDYVTFFNAVNRNDRDSADLSTTIRTNSMPINE
jgi:hypothetical protein